MQQNPYFIVPATATARDSPRVVEMTMVMTMAKKTQRVYSKSRLKAHMLEIMRELEASGEEAIVTDHGRPVLRIVPFAATNSVDEVFRQYRGKLRFLEHPNTPTMDEWSEA